MRLGNLEVDLDRLLVRLDGRIVPFSYFQFRCLRLLVRKRETIVSRDDLCRELWGEVTPEENLRLNSQLSILRHRLAASTPWSIRTVHLRGYMLTADDPDREPNVRPPRAAKHRAGDEHPSVSPTQRAVPARSTVTTRVARTRTRVSLVGLTASAAAEVAAALRLAGHVGRPVTLDALASSPPSDGDTVLLAIDDEDGRPLRGVADAARECLDRGTRVIVLVHDWRNALAPDLRRCDAIFAPLRAHEVVARVQLSARQATEADRAVLELVPAAAR